MKSSQSTDKMERIETEMALFLEGMKELRSSQQETYASIKELRESQKQTDAQIAKTEALLAKTIKKLDAVGRQLGDLGLVQGEVAEELFYRNVVSMFKPQALRFEKV